MSNPMTHPTSKNELKITFQRLPIQKASVCKKKSSRYHGSSVHITPPNLRYPQYKIKKQKDKTKKDKTRTSKICAKKIKSLNSIGSYTSVYDTLYLGDGQQGIFANKHTFQKGEIITWFDGKRTQVSAKDKNKIKKTSLLHQAISIDQHSVIICSKNSDLGKGGGYFANYGISKKAAKKHNLQMFTVNTKITNIVLNGCQMPVLVATKPIHHHEQLLIPQKGMGLKEAIKKGEAMSEKKIIQRIKNLYVFCRLCNFYSTSKKSLSQHKREIHFKGKDFSCSLCRKYFVFKKTLLRHMENHKKTQKPICICPICDKILSSQQCLRRHKMYIHDKQPSKFECFTCGVLCKTSCSLRVHNNTVHTKRSEYKFQCSTCQEKFARRDILNSHMISHTNTYDYPCEYCGNSYKHFQSRNRHKKNKHLNQKPTEYQNLNLTPA